MEISSPASSEAGEPFCELFVGVHVPVRLLVGAERHGLRTEDVVVDATLCVKVRDDLEGRVDCIHDNQGLFVRLNFRDSRGRTPGRQRRGRVVWGYPLFMSTYTIFVIIGSGGITAFFCFCVLLFCCEEKK